MKFIFLIPCLTMMFIVGCQTIDSITVKSVQGYASPEQMVTGMKLNGNDGKGKEYIYYWGHKYGTDRPNSLIPKEALSKYCLSKNGSFTQIQISPLPFINSISTKSLLKKYKIDESIGGYRCTMPDSSKSWDAMIEASNEKPINSTVYDSRIITLHTKILTTPVEIVYANLTKEPEVKRTSSVAAAATKAYINDTQAKGSDDTPIDPKKLEALMELLIESLKDGTLK